MKLKELCVLDVVSCRRSTTITDAARLMRQHHTGDLVIVDDSDGTREPVGVLTDRDIVMEVIAKGRDPNVTTAADVMGSPVVVASSSEDVGIAVDRMRTHGVRRLPIVDERGTVFGIITLDDLHRALAEHTAALAAIVSKQQTHEHRNRR